MALGALIPAISIVSMSSSFTVSTVKNWVVAMSLTSSTALKRYVCSVPEDSWLKLSLVLELVWEQPQIRQNADIAATRGRHFAFIIHSPSFLKIIQLLSKLTEISVYMSSPRPDQWQAQPPKRQSRYNQSARMESFRYHPCQS